MSEQPVQLKRKRKLTGLKFPLGDFRQITFGTQLFGPGSRVQGVNIPQRDVRAAQHQRWRQWDTRTATRLEVQGFPLSALSVPRDMSHVTDYTALPSIQQTGLDPSFRNARTGLNVAAAAEGNPQYMVRDAHLAGIYTGTSDAVGTSMESADQTGQGGRVNLIARTSPGFRLRHVRPAPSVISDPQGRFDYTGTNSNTAISFGQIPPSSLHLQGTPLTSPNSYPLGFDYRTVATKPQAGFPRLPSHQEVQDEAVARAQVRARLEQEAAAYVEPARPQQVTTAPIAPSQPTSNLWSAIQRHVALQSGNNNVTNQKEKKSSKKDDDGWDD